jgi:hypothetical protein
VLEHNSYTSSQSFQCLRAYAVERVQINDARLSIFHNFRNHTVFGVASQLTITINYDGKRPMLFHFHIYRNEPIGGDYVRHLLPDGPQDLVVSLAFQDREEERVHHDMSLRNLFQVWIVLGQDTEHHVDDLIIEELAIQQLFEAVLQVELRSEQIQLGLARR